MTSSNLGRLPSRAMGPDGTRSLILVILAIDTSAGTSVAIVADGQVLAEHSIADTMRHAEVVGTLILDCLKTARVAATDITAVVAGMGPGPFTGLRVGIAAAQAFAVGADVPLLPLVSHDAIAEQYFATGAQTPLTVVTDARRREVYWSTFSGLDTGGLPQRISGPNLAKQGEVPAMVADTSPQQLTATEVSAGALALIAERRLRAGIPAEPFAALYLRSPDITLSKGPKRVVQ